MILLILLIGKEWQFWFLRHADDWPSFIGNHIEQVGSSIGTVLHILSNLNILRDLTRIDLHR